MSKSHRRGTRRERRRFHRVESIERRLLLSAGGYTAGGIHGTYYASTDLSGAVAFDRQDVRIDFDWGTTQTPGGSNSPGFNSIGHDDFSAKWVGQLVAGQTQTYTFDTSVDSADGTRVLIRPAGSGGTWATLIDDWSGKTPAASGSFAMTAGATYDIEMDYFHTTGAAAASLHWSGPNTPDEVIGPAGITGINAATYGPALYADAMKSGRNFWEGGVAQDANGWPLADATNIPWEGVEPASVAGTYLLTFTGQADVTADVGGASIFVANGQTFYNTLPKATGYDPATNTTTATLTLSASNAGILSLEFNHSQRTASDAPDTGVTNVQLMRPTAPGAATYYAPGTLFTATGKQAMSAFTTERWLTTNLDITQVNWSDRVLPTHFKADIPGSEVWEDLVAFANETGKDLYFTIPMNASSDYVTKLAELIKYGSDGVNPYTSPQANPAYPGLNSNLKLYVEWCNETWNPGFAQYQAGEQDSAQAVQNNTPEGQIINYDGSSPGGNWQRWTALKTVEASQTFRAVWGDAAMGSSVRMLLEYQYYNLSDSAYNELGFINNYFDNGDGVQHVTNPHPVSYYLWGAGGPNYYGFNNWSGTPTSNGVPDSSFGTPAVPAGTAQVDPAGSGWTFAGNSGIYNLGSNASAQLGALGTPPSASNGSQAAFIGDTGSISTTLNFTSTGVFAIQLDGADKINSPNAIHVYLDGQEITPYGSNYEPTYVPWTPGDAPGYNYGVFNTLDTAPFTIKNTGNHTLTITGAGATGTYTYLDNIQVASEDKIFQSGLSGVATVDSYQGEINLEARYALEFGLHNVAYEGGWVAVGSPLLSYAEFVDPRAEQTTIQSIDTFAAAVGSLFMMGTFPAWQVDSTGTATSSPVYQGVLTADAALPATRTTPAPHLFLITDRPATADQNVSNSAIASAGGAELGMKFQSNESGYVTGVRFWAGTQNTGSHTGELWSDSGQLLATVSFASVAVGGWQLAYFSSPVAITANRTYIVSYHTTASSIADTPGTFATTGIDNQNLHGLAAGVDGPNGVYALGATSAFPNASDGQSPNYWVDAIFSDHVPVAPSAPFNVGGVADSLSQVTIHWGDAAGEVTEYDIERSLDGVNYTLVGSVYEKYKFVDTTVQPGTSYYYRISAQNAGSHSWGVVIQVSSPKPVSPTGTAAFAGSDTTTSGDWTKVYGADGYEILGGNSASLPSYAQLGMTGGQSYVWDQNSTDPRAPKIAPGSASRIASCDYATQSFSLNLNLTDGQAHQVALYLLDYDSQGRSQTVKIVDTGTGQVLDAQSVNSFSGGQWLVWKLSGNLQIVVTNAGGMNAVASAIAFGPKPAATTTTPAGATFVSNDTTTSGSWGGVYGSDGYSIAGGRTSLPAYANLSFAGNQTYAWQPTTTDPRAPQQSPTSSIRTAACDYSYTNFSLDLNLTDGQTHRVGLYLLDYDHYGRAETIQVADASTGTILDTRSATQFASGLWMFWDLTGHVTITITHIAGDNAVLSGIVFDPAKTPTQTSAAFVRTDSTTLGHWSGNYGADGYSVFNSNSSLPGYAQLSASGEQAYTWQQGTTDPRALQSGPASTQQIGACYYAASSFSLDLNLTDGKSHQVALYLTDYDRQGRSETVQVTDAATGAVLDTRSVSNFQGGQYLVWNVSGHVRITIANVAGPNAVASGLFFDPTAS